MTGACTRAGRPLRARGPAAGEGRREEGERGGGRGGGG